MPGSFSISEAQTMPFRMSGNVHGIAAPPRLLLLNWLLRLILRVLLKLVLVLLKLVLVVLKLVLLKLVLALLIQERFVPVQIFKNACHPAVPNLSRYVPGGIRPLEHFPEGR